MFNEKYKLSNGVHMPKVGLGTWLIKNDVVTPIVADALEVGYRHIDTAPAYMNEGGVAEAIHASGIPREELFIATKVGAESKKYDGVVRSIDRSLKKMNLDYIDLLLIHSPQPWKEFREENRYFEENKEVWRAMEDAYKEGKVKAIGLCNFLQDDIENLLESCEIKPMVNQILAHISNTPFELIEFCQKHDILVEAYSPIGHGEVLQHSRLQAMAEHYGVSVAQLCLRYDLQLGLSVIPKSTDRTHMEENTALDFEINEADMEALKQVEKIESYGKDSIYPVFGGKIK